MSLVADDHGDDLVRARHRYSGKFAADFFWTWAIVTVLFASLVVNVLQLNADGDVIADADVTGSLAEGGLPDEAALAVTEPAGEAVSNGI